MVNRNPREHAGLNVSKVRKMNIRNILGEGGQRHGRNGKPFRQRKDVNWSVMRETEFVP